MGRKIIFQQAAAPQPQAVEIPSGGHNELVDRLWAAVACGVAACVLVLLVGTAMMTPFRLVFPQVGLAALVVGGTVGAFLALWWSWEIIRRPQKIEDSERSHRHALDLLDREIRNGVASQPEPPQPEYPSPERLNAVALNILKRHFAGEKTTREACTGAGICTQPEWNTVNTILLKTGLKKGYRIRGAGTLANTWQAWKERVRFDTNRAWAKEGRGSWVAVEFEQQ